MKKITILMVAAATAGLVSCTAQPKADLKTDIDSLAYATGMARTEGLMSYLTQQAGVDSTYMSDFMRGFSEGSANFSDKDAAYLEGIRIGQMVSKNWVEGINRELFGADSKESIKRENLLAGFLDGLSGKGKMNMMEAQSYAQASFEKVKEKAMMEQYADNKEAGEKFLAENKNKEGVVTTESGLQYKVIAEGKGKVATESSTVKVHYKGTLIDGTEFDSSYSRNEPTTFRANQVIKGWTEALILMPEGSKWELYIPQDLAYGGRDQGQIKPFSTLIFEVEVLEVKE